MEIIVILIVIGIGINIFQKVTGVNLTGDKEEPEKPEPEKVLSPLEEELEEIKAGSSGKTKKIAQYVALLYNQPYVDMGGYTSVTIDTIVSRYLDNQLLFSEEYENHVIDLIGYVGTIGKDGENVYLSIGDGHYYDKTGESVRQLIKCYLDNNDMEDENYKKTILNMRPSARVILVGILKKEKYGDFVLYETTVIEVDWVVPDMVMNIAENIIYKKYNDTYHSNNTTGYQELNQTVDKDPEKKAEIIDMPSTKRIQDAEGTVTTLERSEEKPTGLAIYIKKAEQGDVYFQMLTAQCYAEGDGVEKSEVEALYWYKKAAEQGNVFAQVNVGKRFFCGKGVEENKEEAIRWYRKAAEQGFDDAQCKMGEAYLRGEGTEQNEKEAIRWYEKAAKQGNKEAKTALQEIKNN